MTEAERENSISQFATRIGGSYDAYRDETTSTLYFRVTFPQGPVTEEGLKDLNSLPSLRELDFTGCEFEGDGLKHLAECEDLKTLVFTGSGLNDGMMQL